MKSAFVYFLLFLAAPVWLFSQSFRCGSTFTESNLRHFLEVKKSKGANLNRSNETIYIPIKFHAVANSEGAGRIRLEKILDQLCAINESYIDLGIQFYMKDGSVNNVDNTTVYSNPSSAAGTTKMVGIKSDFGKNAVNIFISDNISDGPTGEGTTLGYYDFNQDLIVLKKSVPSLTIHLNLALGHELGHFFSLPHTFNGWDHEPWDGTPVTSTTSPSGVLNELADGSNCNLAGDMICDTPADYNLGFGWDGCRNYDGGCKDPKGILLNPDEANFMGYFIGCDQYFFSEEQSSIILNDYFGPRRAYLRVNFKPEDKVVGEVANTILPIDGSTTSFYNGVQLEWEAAENAEQYLVELTQALSKFYYVTSEPSLFLTDLESDKSYRWKVKPFSAVNTCADFSSTSQFRTGTMTTSISEIENNPFKVNIFPNPLMDESLNIQVEDVQQNLNLLELYNVNGKKVFSEVFRTNSIQLDNLDLNPGIYFVNIKNENRNVIKKLVVNE